jgi:hypothetical protein
VRQKERLGEEDEVILSTAAAAMLARTGKKNPKPGASRVAPAIGKGESVGRRYKGDKI